MKRFLFIGIAMLFSAVHSFPQEKFHILKEIKNENIKICLYTPDSLVSSDSILYSIERMVSSLSFYIIIVDDLDYFFDETNDRAQGEIQKLLIEDYYSRNIKRRIKFVKKEWIKVYKGKDVSTEGDIYIFERLTKSLRNLFGLNTDFILEGTGGPMALPYSTDFKSFFKEIKKKKEVPYSYSKGSKAEKIVFLDIRLRFNELFVNYVELNKSDRLAFYEILLTVGIDRKKIIFIENDLRILNLIE